MLLDPCEADLLDGAHFNSKRAECIHIPGLSDSEAEILADHDTLGTERADQNPVAEFTRRQCG